MKMGNNSTNMYEINQSHLIHKKVYLFADWRLR